ncbi:MAG: sulfatase family protein [Bryobacteraceae bacterium]
MRCDWKRRDFLAGLAGCATGALSPAQTGSDSPNFIIILTDDQGYGDLGIYGSPHIRTPNVDRMAREGVRFTDFYAQPMCGPSRAALLTGCYPVRNSLMFNHLPRAKTGIHANEITLAELLKQRGYATMIAGKWHLGDAPEFLPMRHGFDEWIGLPYSNDMWPFHPKVRVEPPPPRLSAARKRAKMTGYDGQGQIYPPDWFPDLPLMSNDTVVERNPDQSRLTELYTGKSLSFLRRNKDRPFFLYLAHAMPHVPLFPGENFAGRSVRGRYGDVIEEIDDSTGRILSTLRELGIAGRTLVIFTSDNGPWLQYGIDAGSAGPLRGGKGTTWEGGVRVPMIACWPGRIPPGIVTSEVAAGLDLLPTLGRLAGAALPTNHKIDGRDIWPLMSRPGASSPRDSFFYFAGSIQYKAAEGRPVNQVALNAVRKGKWKLHVAQENGALRGRELYDLNSDAGERHNVISRHSDVVRDIEQFAQAFRDQLRGEIRPLGRLREA